MEKVRTLCSSGLCPPGLQKPSFPALPPCVCRERSTGCELLTRRSAGCVWLRHRPSETLTTVGLWMPAAQLGARLKKPTVLRRGKWNAADKTSLKLGQNLGVTFTGETNKQKKHLENSLFLNLPHYSKKFSFFWSANVRKWGMWGAIATTEYGADPLK